MRIKKVNICIKVVCNYYCFYNFIMGIKKVLLVIEEKYV